MKAKITFKDGTSEVVEAEASKIRNVLGDFRLNVNEEVCQCKNLRCSECALDSYPFYRGTEERWLYGCDRVAAIEEVKEPRKLEVGDIVRDILTDEKLEAVALVGEKIKFCNGFWSVSDGREFLEHKNPRFVFVGKTKKKETIRWLCIQKGKEYLFSSKADAIEFQNNFDGVDIIEMVSRNEVEE